MPTGGESVLKTVGDKLWRELQPSFIADVLTRRFGKKGVRIGSCEKEAIRKWAREDMKDNLVLFAEDTASISKIEIKITPRETRRMIAKLREKVSEGIAEILTATVKKSAPEVLEKAKKDWLRSLKQQKKEFAGFEKRLAKRWAQPLEALDFQIALGRELAVRIRAQPKISEVRWSALTSAIIRLQVRACRIAAEVSVLLKSGFAEGAMARWRSLHESAVTSIFLHKGGETLAQAYLDHLEVESYKAANQYRLHSSRLGFAPIEDSELAELKKEYDDMLAKHGSDFKEDYGWAAKVLSNKRPSFADIEKATDLSHFRPFYKLASHGVHANAKGIFFNLGMATDDNLIMLGPTNFGLTDPGQNTAISILQITGVLVQLAPTFDNLLILGAMTENAPHIGELFAAVQTEIEKEEAAIQRKV